MLASPLNDVLAILRNKVFDCTIKAQESLVPGNLLLFIVLQNLVSKESGLVIELLKLVHKRRWVSEYRVEVQLIRVNRGFDEIYRTLPVHRNLLSCL